MPTTIRAREPREILALIPFQLGFQPVESVVLLSVRGERSRIGLALRVDLAELADPVGGAQVARALIGHLVADGAHHAVVVLYTGDDLQDHSAFGRPAHSPGTVATNHLRDAADHFFDGLDCWVVGPDGYYALGCTDRSCCPLGGRPLADLQGTQVGAQMVLEGVQIAPTRGDLLRIERVDRVTRKSARRSVARWRARGLAAKSVAERHRWRRDGLAQWRETFDRAYAALGAEIDGTDPVGAGERGVAPATYGTCPWDPPGSAVVGRLLAALEDVLVRDAVLVSFVAGSDRVADRLIAGDGDAGLDDVLKTIVDPVRGRRPDPRRAAAARTVLELMVAHAGRDGHAPAFTLLALLAWWEGDGARAGVAIDLAFAAEPGYRLARLVDDALRAGLPPGWVRADRA